MTIRSASRLTHLALGLIGGVSVVVAGLTGSLLVYRGEVDRLLNPGLHHVQPTGTDRPLEEVRAAVERDGGPPLRLILPAVAPGRSTIAVLVGKGPEDRWEVFVDPGTAKVLGRRRLDRAWTHRLEKLHAEWLAGKAGKLVVGAGGLASLLLGATGSALWLWTRRRSKHRDLPTPPATALDLHRTVGIITLIPSLILAASGAMLVFRPYIAPALNLATGPMPLEAIPKSGPKQASPPPTLDSIRDRASKAFPDATLTRIYTPEGPGGTFAVRLRLPEEASPHGNTAMRFDRHTGATLQVHSSRMANPTQQLLWYAAYPWHTGDALGPIGRAITALSGLAPTVLLITGLLWWRRKAGRKPKDGAGIDDLAASSGQPGVPRDAP